MSFKFKQNRANCWMARDQYWDCLNADTSPTNDPCKALKSLLEANCPNQWIKHFERKRQHLLLIDKVEKEFSNLDKTIKKDNSIRIYRVYKPI